MMEKVCIILLSAVILLLILREKNRPEKKEIDLFCEKAQKLITEFNSTAEKNIDLLEEKIEEAKGVTKGLDERLSYFSEKHLQIFRYNKEGLSLPEIAEKVRMSQAEVELILKQAK
jgi:Uma2 family endonuclease